jgi:hypothetical protein
MLTQKEIASRWGTSVRTVRRAIATHAIEPDSFIGLEPVLSPSTLQKLEARRMKRIRELHAKRRLAARTTSGVVTVADAKRRAGR